LWYSSGDFVEEMDEERFVGPLSRVDILAHHLTERMIHLIFCRNPDVIPRSMGLTNMLPLSDQPPRHVCEWVLDTVCRIRGGQEMHHRPKDRERSVHASDVGSFVVTVGRFGKGAWEETWNSGGRIMGAPIC